MMTRLEELADIQNDTHLKTPEKWRILSAAIAATWDKIISSGLGTNYLKTVTFNAVGNQRDYNFSTIFPDGDFYKISDVWVDEGNGQRRPISRVHPSMIQSYRAPVANVPMIVRYIPCAPVWTGTGDVNFDGINGWEEHALNLAAIAVKKKKEDDTGPYRATVRELEARMDTMNNVNAQDPPRVVRKRRTVFEDRYYPWRNNVGGWDIVEGTNGYLSVLYRYGVDY
jgi:hypothetical protein